MKSPLISIALFLWANVATANPLMLLAGSPPASSPCAGYLVCQNYEGTGYDNSETWTAYREESSPGTINPDYTATVLRGSQSLYLLSSDYRQAGIESPTFSTTTASFHGMLRVITLASTNAHTIKLFNGTTELATVAIRSNADRRIDISHGSSIDYGQAGDFELNTTYHYWIDYLPSTGTNGTMSFYISTTSTKPGSALGTITAGTSTLAVTKLRLISNYGLEIIYDYDLIDDTAIGSVAD